MTTGMLMRSGNSGRRIKAWAGAILKGNMHGNLACMMEKRNLKGPLISDSVIPEEEDFTWVYYMLISCTLPSY